MAGELIQRQSRSPEQTDETRSFPSWLGRETTRSYLEFIGTTSAREFMEGSQATEEGVTMECPWHPVPMSSQAGFSPYPLRFHLKIRELWLVCSSLGLDLLVCATEVLMEGDVLEWG